MGMIPGIGMLSPKFNTNTADGKYVYIVPNATTTPQLIYRSENYGASFSSVSIPDLLSSGSTYMALSTNGHYVYILVGGSFGNQYVYASSNYGISFTKVYSYPDNTFLRSIDCSPDGAVVCTMETGSTNTSTMYYSLNYGSAFSTRIITYPYTTYTGLGGISICTPTGSVVYLGIETGGLLKSTTGVTGTFTFIADVNLPLGDRASQIRMNRLNGNFGMLTAGRGNSQSHKSRYAPPVINYSLDIFSFEKINTDQMGVPQISYDGSVAALATMQLGVTFWRPWDGAPDVSMYGSHPSTPLPSGNDVNLSGHNLALGSNGLVAYLISSKAAVLCKTIDGGITAFTEINTGLATTFRKVYTT